MKGYCTIKKSCGANKKKMEDRSVIKGKLKIKRQNITTGLSFLGELIREERREWKNKNKRRREGRREEDQRYGKVWNLYGN